MKTINYEDVNRLFNYQYEEKAQLIQPIISSSSSLS